MRSGRVLDEIWPSVDERMGSIGKDEGWGVKVRIEDGEHRLDREWGV